MTIDKFILVADKPTIVKDPQAILDYYIDFSSWIPAGDTVDTFAATGTGVTVDSYTVVDGVMQIWVSGGVLGVVGHVIGRLTTVQGRTDERTVYFRIKNR